MKKLLKLKAWIVFIILFVPFIINAFYREEIIDNIASVVSSIFLICWWITGFQELEKRVESESENQKYYFYSAVLVYVLILLIPILKPDLKISRGIVYTLICVNGLAQLIASYSILKRLRDFEVMIGKRFYTIAMLIIFFPFTVWVIQGKLNNMVNYPYNESDEISEEQS